MVARGTIAGFEGGDIHTATGASGSHPEEATQQVPSIGHSLHSGSGSTDIGTASAGADI